jgi:hypothetical protein
MSGFDPERDGWHLRDAVMRTERQEFLAIIRDDMKELRARGVPFDAPHLWSEDLAPPAANYEGPARSDQELMLSLGSLVAVVEAMFSDKLYTGKLVCWGRPGSSRAQYEQAPVWAVTGIESWWKGGGILRLESGNCFTLRGCSPASRRGGWFSKKTSWIGCARTRTSVNARVGQ